MIKKLLAISNHGSMLGGGEYSFLDLISHLPNDWKPLAVLPQRGTLFEKLREKNIETEVIDLPQIRPWNIHRVLYALRSHLAFCLSMKPHLIYANGSRAAFYAGIVGRLLGIPMIWHCRMVEPEFLYDLLLASLSKQIIANSRFTAGRFHSTLKHKVTVVYNGINLSSHHALSDKKISFIKPNWKVILVVARISRWKRHDLVLEAFEELAKHYSDIHLICLGSQDSLDPEWWRLLQCKINQSSFQNRIHWIGQVDDPLPWYRRSYLLVLASENEPFGRVLIESMACGLPVVASRSGGVLEIFRDHRDGILFDPGDSKSLMHAISHMLTDHYLRENIILSAYERADFFNLSTHVKEMLNVFESILKK